MGFFDRIFGKDAEEGVEPDVRFGRYSDSYKTEEQYDAWDMALDLFDDGEYLPAYHAFFKYLSDEDENNVKYWDEKGGIRFEVHQGSNKITGFASLTKVNAEAKIAKSNELDVDFMRRLLEQNYALKYARFSLDNENIISIKFDTYTLDGSPYKLYYALRELAVNADKQDDLLVDEFKSLQAVDTSHRQELSDHEKEIKYKFVVGQINAVLKEIESAKLDPGQYPGAYAYLLLNLSYKLDFLVKPEGFMMETLERIHRRYFAKNISSTREKNENLIEELRSLKDRPKEDFFKEMYRVNSTFGITTPVNHDRVVGFIDGELGNMDWYASNGFDMIAESVPGYIVGFCLFNYAVPLPDRQYLNLYYRILESDYFKELGFEGNFYDSTTKVFNKKGIIKKIKLIQERNEEKYPRIKPNTGRLNFSSRTEFARSYLIMLRDLDMVVAG